jgi:hypothetical protein
VGLVIAAMSVVDAYNALTKAVRAGKVSPKSPGSLARAVAFLCPAAEDAEQIIEFLASGEVETIPPSTIVVLKAMLKHGRVGRPGEES